VVTLVNLISVSDDFQLSSSKLRLIAVITLREQLCWLCENGNNSFLPLLHHSWHSRELLHCIKARSSREANERAWLPLPHAS